jgi:hypothetical protein
MAVWQSQADLAKDRSLASKGLAHIPRQESRNDFNFIVGEAHSLCPWSVVLRNFVIFNHQIHPRTHFFVSTPDPNHRFCDLLSLAGWYSIVTDTTNQRFAVSIARKFENEELHKLNQNQIHQPFSMV